MSLFLSPFSPHIPRLPEGGRACYDLQTSARTVVALGNVWVGVGYRLSPQHPSPGSVEMLETSPTPVLSLPFPAVPQ